MADGFQFKQFFIAHDKCAMKVNTDGILLGCLAEAQSANRILDLGTGSGLVAVMLAQRSIAQITAVEIEPNAYLQAVENCKKSPFSDRLFVLQHDVAQLALAEKFDLIVANPPYFEHSPAARTVQRDLARTVQESHFHWLQIARNHLAENGKICFILPVDAAEKLIEQSATLNLSCVEQCHIHTKIGAPAKRMVVTFCPQPTDCHKHSLYIYDQNQQYSVEFKQLTKDFYLNF